MKNAEQVDATVQTAADIAKAIGCKVPHERGNIRLAADLADTTVTLEHDVSAALAMLDAVASPVFRKVGLSAIRHRDRIVEMEFEAALIDAGKDDPVCMGYGKSAVEAADGAVVAYRKAKREAEIAARVRAEMSMIEAVEAAERATPVMFKDNGDATTGTLPLTSIGPSGIGGEYQSEVRP